MTNDEDPASPEKVEAAKRFMAEVLEAAERGGIPPAVAVGLFGKITKSMIDLAAESGANHEVQMVRFVSCFMSGVGMVCVPLVTESEGASPTKH
jgi:hypothetical protein